jgi:hypothetical protein
MKHTDEVITMLIGSDFEPDGGIPDVGRRRFRWRDWLVTVNDRTVYFYLPIPNVRPCFNVQLSAVFQTRKRDQIAAFLAALPALDADPESREMFED